MPQEISESATRWPLLFTKRRKIIAQEENQPFIEYLKLNFNDGDAEEEDDTEEGAEYENHDTEEQGEENYEEADQGQDGKLEGEKDIGPSEQYSNVRRFARGLMGNADDALMDHDKVDEISGFCESARTQGPERNSSEDRKCILLDDRKSDDTIADKKGRCRPYLGPLTPREFFEALSSRKRFRDNSDQFLPANTSDDEEIDAERRIVFSTDPDPSTMEAIMMTASRTQAPAINDLIYKYLTGKASIGVTIPSQGFAVFTIDFHIPYFALRVDQALLKDTRRRINGEPVRQSCTLPFLALPTNRPIPSDSVYCLYESQISVSITGIDEWIWTAYAFTDTYFNSNESVIGYHNMKGRWKGRADPLSLGRILADEPIWTPREYYFKVLEFRMEQVLNEWDRMVGKMEQDIKKSRTTHLFPLPANNPEAETRAKVRDFSLWNSQMVKLLTQLISSLADIIRVWEEFRRTDIHYFQDRDQLRTSTPLRSSAAAIDKTFSKLRIHLSKLKELEDELCRAGPHGLNAQFILGNNEAALFQQKAARQLEVLTALTMVFFPLALNANLFSTTNVLPFKPNLVKFICMLFALALLVVLTLLILSKWHSWLKQIADYVLAIFKYYDHPREEEEGESEALAVVPKSLKPNLFDKRFRKPGIFKRWDLESGASAKSDATACSN